MIPPITFCINTSKNERPYLELLLQSLLNGIDVNTHKIIIFVDSDNQNVTEMLVEQKLLFPNLKIVKNNGDPVGYAGNINWMFQIAKTDIVSYIQSDQIVCLKYDEKLLYHLKDNMILSSTRVEPPLHSLYDNSINYVQNFGLTPDEFNYEEFLKYSEKVKDSTKQTKYFFAPFTLYKHLWTDIGGHDTAFKKSREDSDIAFRFCLKKYSLIQCWDAIVYHFSCTSSRGIDWWKQENKERDIIRQENDKIELNRFINKWGTFCHPTSYKEIEEYVKVHPKILDNIIAYNPPINESTLEFI